jgi:hypothetical protein
MSRATGLGVFSQTNLVTLLLCTRHSTKLFGGRAQERETEKDNILLKRKFQREKMSKTTYLANTDN